MAFMKNTVESKNILHYWAKVALLCCKSGTFNAQKCHFCNAIKALFQCKMPCLEPCFLLFYLHIFVSFVIKRCNADFYNCTRYFLYFRPKDFNFQIIKNRGVNENQVVRKTSVLVTLWRKYGSCFFHQHSAVLSHLLQPM